MGRKLIFGGSYIKLLFSSFKNKINIDYVLLKDVIRAQNLKWNNLYYYLLASHIRTNTTTQLSKRLRIIKRKIDFNFGAN